MFCLMLKSILVGVLLVWTCVTISVAQYVFPDGDVNYVTEHTVQVSGVKTVDLVQNAPVDSVNVTINYFDGLGRSTQVVNFQASPGRSDLVQPLQYDSVGRESIKYLPYVSGASGAYKADALADPATTEASLQAKYRSGAQYNFYQQGGTLPIDSFPYATTVFEASPLNRPLKRGAPGEVWQPTGDRTSFSDNTVKMRYAFNAADEVLLFQYDAETGKIDPTASGVLQYYAAQALRANKTYDEHNNLVIEYVDKQGLTVLKKVQYATLDNLAEDEGRLYAETYYIYDDLDNLVVVLPPECVKQLRALFQ